MYWEGWNVLFCFQQEIHPVRVRSQVLPSVDCAFNASSVFKTFAMPSGSILHMCHPGTTFETWAVSCLAVQFSKPFLCCLGSDTLMCVQLGWAWLPCTILWDSFLDLSSLPPALAPKAPLSGLLLESWNFSLCTLPHISYDRVSMGQPGGGQRGKKQQRFPSHSLYHKPMVQRRIPSQF